MRIALTALALVAVAALGVSSSASGRSEAAKCGSLTIDENAWAGATANVYVLKYVLEKNLGCTVNIAKLPESTPLFQAMADGKVDVLLEDWNNIQLKVNQKYVKSGALINLGSNGVIGHIGWFIPTYLMKQYPQFKTWQGLKGKESIFKSPESGSQGLFLGGDPSYVQKDAQLIKQLGLNFKFVSVGAEPAQVARWKPGVQAEEADPLRLVHAAVPQHGLPAVRDQAPSAQQELRRLVQPEARQRLEHLPLRIRADDHREGDHVEVREVGLARRRRDQALEVDGGRSELRRQPHRRQAHGPGEGGGAVGQGQPRQGEGLARQVS